MEVDVYNVNEWLKLKKLNLHSTFYNLNSCASNNVNNNFFLNEKRNKTQFTVLILRKLIYIETIRNFAKVHYCYAWPIILSFKYIDWPVTLFWHYLWLFLNSCNKTCCGYSEPCKVCIIFNRHYNNLYQVLIL